jgi:osmoprotectant transport system permease protein
MSLLAFLAERRSELMQLVAQHVVLVLASLLVAVLLAVPAGVALARSDRGARLVLAGTNAVQTIPSLALFGFLIPLPFVGGIGARTAVIALVLYALLPILRNTVTGLHGVPPALLETATGLGMTASQRLRLVELPLALPVVLAGVRVAAVIGVGTATIAAAIGAGGLGSYVFRGIATVDTRLILAGALPAAALALLADALLGRVEKSKHPGRAALVLAAFALALLAAARSASHVDAATRPRVVVGSKNFTEQVILGEVLAAHLERRGFAVERRLNLGGTSLCHDAVRTGALDVYVEYTGTALVDVLKRKASADRAAVLRDVRDGYAALGLEVGRPLGFDNSFALVVRPEDAAAGLRRLSDLAARARGVRLGCFGEFLERADGLRGLEHAYGFHLTAPPVEMDLGLLYEALAHRRVDVVVGSATDGRIAADGLVVLEDDRGYFPPYEAVPVWNADRVAARPGLRDALDALAGRIDAARMRALNHAVDGAHRDPARVAAELVAELDGAP